MTPDAPASSAFSGEAAGARPTATGLTPRTAAMLAYSGWWLTGALMLVLEPRQPFVRFHARQALLALGAAWLAGALLWVLSVAMAFFSPVLARAAAFCAQLVWGLGVLGWGLGLRRAWQLRWDAMPGFGAPLDRRDA